MAATLLATPGQKFLGAIAPNGDTYMYCDIGRRFYYKNNQKVSTEIEVGRIKVIGENVFVMGWFPGYPFATIFYVNGKRIEVSTEYGERVNDVIYGANGYIVLGTDHYWVNKPGFQNLCGATPETFECRALNTSLTLYGKGSLGGGRYSRGGPLFFVSYLNYVNYKPGIKIDKYQGNSGSYEFYASCSQPVDDRNLIANAFFDIDCTEGWGEVLSSADDRVVFDYLEIDTVRYPNRKSSSMLHITGMAKVGLPMFRICYIGTGIAGRGVVEIDGVDTLLPISATGHWRLPLAVVVQ